MYAFIALEPIGIISLPYLRLYTSGDYSKPI